MQRHQFGDYLRKAREAAGFKLGQFAGMLGVSGPYLSDVELGNRQPFGPEHLARIAEYLPVKLNVLKVLAAETRGAFALEPVTSEHQQTGRALMRRWTELSDAELAQIRQIVGDDGDEDGGGQ